MVRKTLVFPWVLALSVSGCFSTETTSSRTSSPHDIVSGGTTEPTISAAVAGTIPAGAKAAKIVFRQAFPQGSFDPPPAIGTPAAVGSGARAMRVFNADGSLLATGGPTNANWPKWLTNVEIGITGSANTQGTNPDCARFAAAGEDTSATCDWGSALVPPVPSTGEPCGAAPGLYRVSEMDCANTGYTLNNGTGGPNDPVYIRASFSRNSSYLGTGENIMVVLEYAASALNPAPSNPTTCFTGSLFSPTNTGCADQVWQAFLKRDGNDVVQPYLLLVPPHFAHISQAANSSGMGIVTKQFFLPLAADSQLTTLQISRIKALATGATFQAVCNGASTPANSALCVGMVFHSITFYRM